MIRLTLLSYFSLCLGFLQIFPAAEPDQETSLQKLLKHDYFDNSIAQNETKEFTRARIAPLPEFDKLEDWENYRDQLRKEMLEKIVYRGEAANWRDADCQVEWLETLEGGPGYKIQKLRFEAVPGMWIPALIYLPENLSGKVPVILNVNGHDAKGKAVDYKQLRCINQAKRGMIAMNVEWLGMGQLRTPDFTHYKMNQLDLCGTSGLAPFYLSMKRSLDILLSLENADPKRLAVAGLSGGGWQTIVISSLDERVVLSNPVAGYSSFFTRLDVPSDLGDSEQTPSDMAQLIDYHHLTAMRAPRPTLLTYNDKDQCCFIAKTALPPLMETARPFYQLYDKESSLRSHVNLSPGTHNFELDNRQQFYAMLGDFFYPEESTYSAKEIPSEDELKAAEELFVPLPKQNEDFHSLALKVLAQLPARTSAPAGKEARQKWEQEQRNILQKELKIKEYEISAKKVDSRSVESYQANYWHLKMGADWTVPVIELSAENAEKKKTVILLSENGAASMEAEVSQQLEQGNRVLLVDPFNYGVSNMNYRSFLFAMLVSSVGERPLGIQVSQLLGTAEWARKQFQSNELEFVSEGPRSSLVALVTAALKPELIDGLKTKDEFQSLAEVIHLNLGVNEAPELFSFGLLKKFDIDLFKELAHQE